jgi:hypothetical protein
MCKPLNQKPDHEWPTEGTMSPPKKSREKRLGMQSKGMWYYTNIFSSIIGFLL